MNAPSKLLALRHKRVEDLWDAAWLTYAGDFLPCAAIALTCSLPNLLLAVGLHSDVWHLQLYEQLLGLLTYGWAYGALTLRTSCRLGEIDITWEACILQGLRSLPALLLTKVAGLLGLLLLMSPAEPSLLSLSVTVPVVSLERRRWKRALIRAQCLAGAKLSSARLSFALQVILGLELVSIAGWQCEGMIDEPLYRLFAAGLTSFMLPLHAVAITLLYYFLRVNNEGLDLEILSEQMLG